MMCIADASWSVLNRSARASVARSIRLVFM
jgi:hypothetical protein